MTEEQVLDLDGLEDLLGKATKGPWEVNPACSGMVILPGSDAIEDRPVIAGPGTHIKNRHNAALIVSLVNAAPELIARVRRAEREIEEIHHEAFEDGRREGANEQSGWADETAGAVVQWLGKHASDGFDPHNEEHTTTDSIIQSLFELKRLVDFSDKELSALREKLEMAEAYTQRLDAIIADLTPNQHSELDGYVYHSEPRKDVVAQLVEKGLYFNFERFTSLGGAVFDRKQWLKSQQPPTQNTDATLINKEG